MRPYPSVTEEFTVAAVTVLSFLLIGGGGGGRAVFRAAVLILALFAIVGRVIVPAVALTAMPFTVRVTVRSERGQ